MKRFNASVAVVAVLGMLFAESSQAIKLLQNNRPVTDQEVLRRFSNAMPTTPEEIQETVATLKSKGVDVKQLTLVADEDYTSPSTLSYLWSDYVKPVGKGVATLTLAAAIPTVVFLITRGVVDYYMTFLPATSVSSGGLFARSATNVANIERASELAYHSEDGVQYLLPLAWVSWRSEKLSPHEKAQAQEFQQMWIADGGEEEARMPATPQELLAYIQGQFQYSRQQQLTLQEDQRNLSWTGYMRAWCGAAWKALWAVGPTVAFQYAMSSLGIDRILYGTFAYPLAKWVGSRQFASMQERFALSPFTRWIPGTSWVSWVYGKVAEAELLRGARDTIIGIDHLAGVACNTIRSVASTIGGWFGWGSSKS